MEEMINRWEESGPIDRYVDINYSSAVSSANTLPFVTTLMVKDRCLCLHVQRAARALGRRFDEELRPFELTNGQFSLLMSLNRPEPPSMAPVAALLAMDRTTLTAALKPLERRGLLKIKSDTEDRRSRILVLTEKGRTLLARALPVWLKTHEEIESKSPSIDWNGFRENLRAVS
ncbi:MAG TPA: MarR family transcriptional regulator [Terracidiphilus sp.]|nr:MarR family transcriptional regulator [Terracidiphilus sp.]